MYGSPSGGLPCLGALTAGAGDSVWYDGTHTDRAYTEMFAAAVVDAWQEGCAAGTQAD